MSICSTHAFTCYSGSKYDTIVSNRTVTVLVLHGLVVQKEKGGEGLLFFFMHIEENEAS